MLKVNGEAIKFPTFLHAKQMAAVLEELMHLHETGRYEKIRAFLEQTTNLREIRTSRNKSGLLNYVKILNSALFINVFGALPLVIYSKPSEYTYLLVIVILSACLYVLTVIMAYVVHRKATVAATKKRTFVTVILSPVTAMHILKDLTKEAYAHFDYLAIAAALLPPYVFQSAVRKEMLLIAQAKENAADSGLKEFWELRENALLGLLTETNIGMQELLATPRRQDPSAASYCPICLSEYGIGVEKCNDCSVDLRSFDSDALISGSD